MNFTVYKMKGFGDFEKTNVISVGGDSIIITPPDIKMEDWIRDVLKREGKFNGYAGTYMQILETGTESEEWLAQQR